MKALRVISRTAKGIRILKGKIDFQSFLSLLSQNKEKFNLFLKEHGVNRSGKSNLSVPIICHFIVFG